MTNRAANSRLRDVLAELYADVASARRVVADAGLDARYIKFSQHAINNWQAILEKAIHTNKLDSLVNVVLEEYSTHEGLREAWT